MSASVFRFYHWRFCIIFSSFTTRSMAPPYLILLTTYQTKIIAYLSMCVRVCVHVWMRAYVRVCMCGYVPVWVCGCVRSCTRARAFAGVRAYVCVRACTCACLYVGGHALTSNVCIRAKYCVRRRSQTAL